MPHNDGCIFASENVLCCFIFRKGIGIISDIDYDFDELETNIDDPTEEMEPLMNITTENMKKNSQNEANENDAANESSSDENGFSFASKK